MSEALSSEIEPVVTLSGSTVVVETLGREITRALHTHTDPAQTTPMMTRAGRSFRTDVRIGMGAVTISETLKEADEDNNRSKLKSRLPYLGGLSFALPYGSPYGRRDTGHKRKDSMASLNMRGCE